MIQVTTAVVANVSLSSLYVATNCNYSNGLDRVLYSGGGGGFHPK